MRGGGSGGGGLTRGKLLVMSGGFLWWGWLERDVRLGRRVLGGVGGIWRLFLPWSSRFLGMLQLLPRPESGLRSVEVGHCWVVVWCVLSTDRLCLEAEVGVKPARVSAALEQDSTGSGGDNCPAVAALPSSGNPELEAGECSLSLT